MKPLPKASPAATCGVLQTKQGVMGKTGKWGKLEKGKKKIRLRISGRKIKKGANPRRGGDIGDAMEESRLVGLKSAQQVSENNFLPATRPRATLNASWGVQHAHKDLAPRISTPHWL